MRIVSANDAARSISAGAALPGTRLDAVFPGLEAVMTDDGGRAGAPFAYAGREYLVRSSIVVAPRSGARAAVAALSDVTELIGEQERLERLVEERVARLEASELGLQAALAEKEMLLKEIHHRVKNNLQVVTSLIQLQSRRISDETAKEALIAVTRRIRSIGLVHDRIYRSSAFDRVDLGRYVDDLVALLSSTFTDQDSPVAVELPETPLEVGPDACVDIGLLLNEAVMNAFKHGRSSSGASSIVVALSLSDGMVVLEVRDGGPGFPPGGPDAGASLGTRVISVIAAKYGARVEYRNEGGAIVSIFIPADALLAPG
jgi:two-component sensor histidine kinase